MPGKKLFPIIFLIQTLAVYSQNVYWSEPRPVVSSAQFNQSAFSDALAVVMWQEFEATGPDAGQVFISIRRSTDGLSWENFPRVIGPYPYKGKRYRSFSVAVSADGRVFAAAATGERVVSVYASSDQGRTFSEYARLTADQTVVVPEISVDYRRGLTLFVSYILENDQGIYHARSNDGREWTPLSPFVTAVENLIQPSLPFHLAAKGREYVVFQARKSRPTEFQLFCKISSNGGVTWSDAASLTEKMAALDGQPVQPLDVSNQRPFLAIFRNGLYLTWERNLTGRSPQIYLIQLTDAGTVNRPGSEERISAGAAGTSANPQLVAYNNQLHLLWFENAASGFDHVMFTAWEKAGAARLVRDLSRAVPGGSFYPQAVVLKGFLSLFWQNQTGNANRLFFLGPDRSVAPPVLTALNFVPSGYGRLSNLQVRWENPEDSSGIRETKFALSRQPEASPAKARSKAVVRGEQFYQENFPISGEGPWYVLVFAVDLAGNVSTPARLAYTRDTTPPGPVRFTGPVRDERGYVASNTFTISWEPPADDAVGGYACALKQLRTDYQALDISISDYPLPGIIPSQTASHSDFKNLKNGVYAYSVSAFDKAGNRGEPETQVFRLNLWQAETYITTVVGQADQTGVLVLKILGGGFREGGTVNTVIIDRDGRAPFDYEFQAVDKAFRVENDRIISGLSLKDVDEGVYQVGVRHPARGLRFSGAEVVKIDATGVIKYGAYGEAARTPVASLTRYLVTLSFADIMLWLIVLTLVVIFFFSTRKVAILAREASGLRADVDALIAGGELTMPSIAKKIAVLRKRGLGLRVKFTLLISLLALLIVVIVAVTISIYMIRTQQSTLAGNLRKEVNIVLSGIVRGSRDSLLVDKSRFRVRDNLEKQYSLLPDEARYAAVTGPRFVNPRTGQLDLTDSGKPDLTNMEHVWAAVGAEVNAFIRGDTDIILGTFFEDGVSSRVAELAKTVNERARERANAIGSELDRAQDEYETYRFRTDAAGGAVRDRIAADIENLQTQLDAELEKIGETPRSIPDFDPERLDLSAGTYVFYKPIVARLSGYDNYFWGVGRLSVSMDNINRLITRSREELVIQTGIIALIVLALGITGALVLASMITTPLRRLSQGVAVIRDTQDKTLLKDHQIIVKSHDEIRDLADTVNQMTQGLVKAAVANKELVIGKEVQKMFIPLETDESGKKRSTGAVVSDQIDIFGYYEGAKGVSGDYFDFKKLDDRHYAIIKCDVAGKGVSASLIMVEVATIFLNYFRDWTFKKNGLKIDGLVYRINDMIEERGFKGRFAALNLCLFNAATGVGNFCNAGDNQLYVYRNDLMKIETLSLPGSPAAGVFPSDLVLAQSGFTQETVKLEKGDTLFLFTDGIEEAKRVLRDGEYHPVICNEPGLKDGESHGGTHSRGMGNEELGLQRFHDITGALFNRGRYELVKYHNPIADEELVFDFSDCAGTTEEVVLAVISVEKVFRIYPDVHATEEDVVRIDRKIDAFLERCFNQYRHYFRNRTENQDEPDYYFYSGLKEDEQYDDLTILAIRKK